MFVKSRPKDTKNNTGTDLFGLALDIIAESRITMMCLNDDFLKGSEGSEGARGRRREARGKKR